MPTAAVVASARQLLRTDHWPPGIKLTGAEHMSSAGSHRLVLLTLHIRWQADQPFPWKS